MIDDQMTPEEGQLIQQIRAVSKPKLDAAARESIRQDMLSEFRVAISLGQPHSPVVRPHFSIQAAAILVMAAVVVLVVGLTILQRGNSHNITPDGNSVPTASPENVIAGVSTQTSTVPVVAPTSTPFITPSPLVSPELIPSLTATIQPTVQITPSSTPVSLPTLTNDRRITIEGPVTSISEDELTIYGFRIEVASQHPILQIINVGDVVRVHGVLDSSGAVIADLVSNIPDADPADSIATVGLDGPVEAINGNILIVNGISIQLAPDDPLLSTIQPGSFVSVQGNFQTNGSVIVLVVVNIVVVNTTSVQSDCWYHLDAMGMGHWHCDGMGMGMGDSGMGMGDAMGMGG
jgi:hypothetical protein